jgi:hypothetical protein
LFETFDDLELWHFDSGSRHVKTAIKLFLAALSTPRRVLLHPIDQADLLADALIAAALHFAVDCSVLGIKGDSAHCSTARSCAETACSIVRVI